MQLTSCYLHIAQEASVRKLEQTNKGLDETRMIEVKEGSLQEKGALIHRLIQLRNVSATEPRQLKLQGTNLTN